MSLRAIDRVYPGFALVSSGGGGGGGNTDSETQIVNLTSGSNSVNMGVAYTPVSWSVIDSLGRPLAYQVTPVVGGLTITALKAETNARITVFNN